jgi:peptidyl-prolyl cis-trans isomerase D
VTMLDRMRRHKGWLRWSLLIVVLAFIAFFIPSFLQPPGAAAPTDAIATVNGRRVLAGTYQRAYQQQVMALRQAYGGQLDDQMLEQLGVGQRLMQQLIEEEAMLVEAGRLGLRASSEEVRQRIMAFPAFQQDGRFVGEKQYRQFLQMQRPPLRPAEFEEQIRRQIAGEKLQAMVTGWVHISDAEVEEEYRRRNEKVKLDLAIFTAEQFQRTISPTDADLAAHFEANREQYRAPEKRRVRYLSLDPQAFKARMSVTASEIQERYRASQAMFSTPEQVRASHILFKTEGKDEAEVRVQAERILKRAQAGEDFAALAKQYSEDTSRDQGGDLDFFGRGQMVPEFEEAAWALQPGQITDLVKSDFGFHIIKLTDRRAAATRTLDEVRPQLEDQIKLEKAQTDVASRAEDWNRGIRTPDDLDRLAREQSLAVGDSGLFSRDEPLAGLGFAPLVSAKAFEMEIGKVSERLQTGQGYAWIALTEIQPSALPDLAAVRDRVRDDVIRVRAVEVARTRASTMAQQAARGNFAAAAKAAGVEVRTTDLVTRGTALPEIGINQNVENEVWALRAGQTTAPIATDNAVVVARVSERQDVDPVEMLNARDSLRDELRQERQGAFFAAYMAKARERMTLTYNEAAIRSLLSGR